MLTLGRNYRIGYWAKCQMVKKLDKYTPGSGYYRMCDLEEKND